MLEHDLGHERPGLQVAAPLELEQVALGADHGTLLEAIEKLAHRPSVATRVASAATGPSSSAARATRVPASGRRGRNRNDGPETLTAATSGRRSADRRRDRHETGLSSRRDGVTALGGLLPRACSSSTVATAFGAARLQLDVLEQRAQPRGLVIEQQRAPGRGAVRRGRSDRPARRLDHVRR